MIQIKFVPLLYFLLASKYSFAWTTTQPPPQQSTEKLVFNSFVSSESPKPRINTEDDKFLDEVERQAFHFFWENADPETGLVLDRVNARGVSDTRNIASIAATGFGLVALAIGYERDYEDRAEILKRVEITLKYFSEREVEGNEGFFYHFVNASNGERAWDCEVSSIDTALLVAGALTAGHYFEEHEHIISMAEQIYDDVNYVWMLNGTEMLRMGWKPETEFGQEAWDRYCELMILVLQAVGSLTHPIAPSSWHAIERNLTTYANYTYIDGHGPLFTHQYSHAFIDFRGQRDMYADYFENSVLATKAHKAFCVNELGQTYSSYTDNLWGITASDTPYGYDAWGGPPLRGKPTGEIVPCAAGGSIPFLPEETIAVLRNIRYNYTDIAWSSSYGFIDVFNPLTNWSDPDVIGIDVGITMLMAENYRTEFVWKYYMADEHVGRAMRMVGFSGAGHHMHLNPCRIVGLLLAVVAWYHIGSVSNPPF